MSEKIVIHWFRQDLRLRDNPALDYASKLGKVLPIYIYDDNIQMGREIGEASSVWIKHSLESLNISTNNSLRLYKGNPKKILKMLVEKYSAKHITWNRCYDPWSIKRDSLLKKLFLEYGISVKTFNSSLLWEPKSILKENGEPYRVFTPYYKKGCLNHTEPRRPLSNARVNFFRKKDSHHESFELKNNLPIKLWEKKLSEQWDIGENAAEKKWLQFKEYGLKHYKEGRNIPSQPFTSQMSNHLHHGEISPHQLWHDVKSLMTSVDTEHFLSELGWREFSHYLLYHIPSLPFENIQSKFNQFPWKNDMVSLKAWQRGMTGIPMVDAGMRELWQTGHMHNRLRMIVGSFLVKNLMIDWRQGEKWFWNCLFDADLANNSAGWQWIAGCGADAAPYFRIFNPITQAKNFDPKADYIRCYVPEISNIPTPYIFEPSCAPESILKEANVTLGVTYPYPIVNLKESRKLALDAFSQLKKES